MNDRTRLSIYEMQLAIADRAGYRCEVCGKPLYTGTLQLGHKIPQSKLEKYGKDIIHNPLNMAAVCSLECNKKVDLGIHDSAYAELLDLIKDDLKERE